jgi:DnaJ-domain-containing protein 1
VLLSAHVVQASDVPDEDDIRKLKVAQLKDFLKDRGIACEGCVEKGDFVKKALASRDKPVLAERAARKLPTEPLQKVWAEIANNICIAELGSAEQCKSLSKVVELAVDEYKRKYKRELGTDEKVFMGNTLKHPFKEVGEISIKRVALWMKKENTKSSTAIREKYMKLFVPWFRDVAVDNPNEMYSVIKKKTHDEL